MNGRRAAALVVLGVWAAVLAAHVRREYFKPTAVRLAEGARALAPGTYFYVVRMNGRAIGFASSRLDTVPGGFVFEDLLRLDVPALDTVQEAVARTRIELGRALELRSFDFALASSLGRYSARGARNDDGSLALEIGGGSEVQRSTLHLGEDALHAAALPLRLAAAGELEPGRTVNARVFDPSVLESRNVRVEVTASDTLIVPDSAVADEATGRWHAVTYDTVPVWRVEESFAGVRTVSWLDGDGLIVRAETPLGFTLERTAYELARDEWQRARQDPTRAAGYGAIIESTAIASDVAPAAAGARDRLAVRLRDVDLAGFDLDGGRQSLRGDTLIVVRESLAALEPGYRLPFRGRGVDAEHLAATPLIQADDPAIRRRAARIARGTDDPLQVARRLNDWVYEELRKEIVPSVPSALQVLEARRGDCNEHTVLFVALARALGLPARTAAGLVEIDGRFYYHAWPEVWLGQWVAVDPTLGQFPADASHLRFIIGGLARQLELIRLIGRLRLEVV